MGKSRKPNKRYKKNLENKRKFRKLLSKNIEILKKLKKFIVKINGKETSMTEKEYYEDFVLVPNRNAPKNKLNVGE